MNESIQTGSPPRLLTALNLMSSRMADRLAEQQTPRNSAGFPRVVSSVLAFHPPSLCFVLPPFVTVPLAIYLQPFSFCAPGSCRLSQDNRVFVDCCSGCY